jgi:hypothetical protein
LIFVGGAEEKKKYAPENFRKKKYVQGLPEKKKYAP